MTVLDLAAPICNTRPPMGAHALSLRAPAHTDDRCRIGRLCSLITSSPQAAHGSRAPIARSHHCAAAACLCAWLRRRATHAPSPCRAAPANAGAGALRTGGGAAHRHTAHAAPTVATPRRKCARAPLVEAGRLPTPSPDSGRSWASTAVPAGQGQWLARCPVCPHRVQMLSLMPTPPRSAHHVRSLPAKTCRRAQDQAQSGDPRTLAQS